MVENKRLLSLGAAGLRGVVGSGGLTPENAIDFASALGAMYPGGDILLATDTRQSSEPLSRAALAALLGAGCRVIDGGVLTAGMAQFLVPQLGLAAGLLITGGHQQPGCNALIPLAADGSYFDDLRRRELFDLYHGRRFPEAAADRVKPVEKLPAGALESYWTYLESALDLAAIRRAGLTVIADFCNGAGAVYAREFGERFGLRLIAVNDLPCGVVPRDPEPRPRSESPVRSVVRPLSAALALVFNSDLSRLGLVTDDGEPLSEELTFPLALDYLLERAPEQAVVVTNVCSTRTIDQVVEKHGGRLIRTRVGQAYIAAALAANRGFAGGEGSGGFLFGDRLRGADGFLMAGILLEAVAKQGLPLSARLGRLERYHLFKQTVPCHAAHGYNLLRQLHGKFPAARLSELDGLRFDWPDGFLSARLSTTESVIRVIAEATTAELARKRAWNVRALLEKNLV